jgi:hypothetical protein
MLNISSSFSQGFHVNKHVNGRADMDFVDRDGAVNANILKQINGDDLPGKPLRASYLNNAYRYEVEDAAGNVTKETAPVYILCTDEDVSIYHADNMQLIRTWDEIFFEVPAVKKPQGIWTSMDGFMLLNNNTLQFMQFNTYGNGLFGYPYPSGDYKYAPQAASGYSGYCVFDEAAGTFLGYYPRVQAPLTEVNPAIPPGHNYNDYDLLWFWSQPLYLYVAQNTFAIIKSRVDNSALIVSPWPHYLQSNYFIIGGEYPLAAGLGLLDGKVFTCHGGGSGYGHNVIYYSTGDTQVHYYTSTNQMTTTAAITLPVGEEIVYLEHVYDFYYEVNLFYALANKGGEWFLHVYDMEGATPDINPTPVATYTGHGAAVNAVYRHPDMHMNF